MLVTTFAPLGNLNDLTGTKQLGDWSAAVEVLMSSAIADVEKEVGRNKGQFADPSRIDMGGTAPTQIGWKGFPLSLEALGLSEQDAFRVADGFMKDPRHLTGRDVQDEYLEWYVQRDANGDVTQIDFTTEGPEYWDTLVTDLGVNGVMALYQKYYPDAKVTDVFPGGRYDRNNVFNTTRGAMHLRQKNNFLSAEVEIAALSTISWTRNGQVLQSGADLCNYAGLGVATRASDPHIAETVNGVAQTGCRVSLQDPIGLYMDPPDFAGWKTPNGSPPAALWVNERGNPLTRASLRSAPGFKLSEVQIAGQNVQYGGQVAKLVGVHLTGLVSASNTVAPTRVPVESMAIRSPSSTALALLTLPTLRHFSLTGR